MLLDLDDGALQDQIHHLQLDVTVAWIGSHLNSFVRQQVARGLPVLFFNWVPNDLTASESFSRVHFPSCRATSHQIPKDCDFEIHQLSKMMWSKLKSHTPEAYHLISKMHFDENEFEDLLHTYTVQSMDGSAEEQTVDTVERTACEWLQNNTDKWSLWLPENLSTKQRIYLGGMFPLTGPYWRQPGIVPGVMLNL